MSSDYYLLKAKADRYFDIILTAGNADLANYAKESFISSLEEDIKLVSPTLEAVKQLVTKGTTQLYQPVREILLKAAETVSTEKVGSLFEAIQAENSLAESEASKLFSLVEGNLKEIRSILKFEFESTLNQVESLLELLDEKSPNTLMKQLKLKNLVQDYILPELVSDSRMKDNTPVKKNLFWFFLEFILFLAEQTCSSSWKTRLFAVSLLDEICKEPSFFLLLEVTSTQMIALNPVEIEIKSEIKELLCHSALFGCLRDRVTDFNNPDSICLFKEAAAKLAAKLCTPTVLSALVQQDFLKQPDWQLSFAYLTVFKHSVKLNKQIQVEEFIFSNFESIVKLKNEEIVNVSIEVVKNALEKVLTEIPQFIAFIPHFLSLFPFFDDINQGAATFIESLLLISRLIKLKLVNEKSLLNQVKQAVETNLGAFCFHLMDKVREQLFSILFELRQIFEFDPDFEVEMVFIAFNLLSVESNKAVVHCCTAFSRAVLEDRADHFYKYLESNKTTSTIFRLFKPKKLKREHFRSVPSSSQFSAESLFDLLLSKQEEGEETFYKRLKRIKPLLGLLASRSTAFKERVFSEIGSTLCISEEKAIWLEIYSEILSTDQNKQFIYDSAKIDRLLDKKAFELVPIRVESVSELSLNLKKLLEDCSTGIKGRFSNLLNLVETQKIVPLREIQALLESFGPENQAAANIKTFCTRMNRSHQRVFTSVRAFLALSSFRQHQILDTQPEKYGNFLNSFLSELKLYPNKAIVKGLYDVVLEMPLNSQSKAICMVFETLIASETGKKAVKKLISLVKDSNIIESQLDRFYSNKSELCETFLLLLLKSKSEAKVSFNLLWTKYLSTANSINLEKITDLLTNYQKIFNDIDTVSLVKLLFSSPTIEKLKILNGLSKSETFQLPLLSFLFDTIKLMNANSYEFRVEATQLFSRLIKLVSVAKLDKSYSEQISQESQSLISSILQPSSLSTTPVNLEIEQLNLKIPLREYQKIGVQWLKFLGKTGLSGCLCDDMGLGKTVQTLVAVVTESIMEARRSKEPVASLIVVPPTLVSNWISEAKKFFAPELLSVEVLPPVPVLNSKVTLFVAPYSSQIHLVKAKFFYVVLDEAHIIKNPESKVSVSIKKLECTRRIALTGTPIQNNVMEFWTIFDFLMPGFLGDKSEFNRKYHKKINTSLKKLNLAEKVQENIFQTSLGDIRRRIKPFVLRRLKTDVLKELPDKIIQDYSCELTPVQRKYYDKIAKQLNLDTVKDKRTVSLTFALRKVCNGVLADESRNNEETVVNSAFNTKLLSLRDIFVSIDFVNKEKRENKVLLFSQFNQNLEIVENFLREEYPHLRSVRMRASMSSEERVRLAEEFNREDSADLMLLTTSIGGLGLTLTGANIVVMFDHDWNPMKDLQAMDRAHRIGQRKVVYVYRLICKDTIEEQLISLQQFKKIVGEQVVGANQISDKNIDVDNFMGALEEIGRDKEKPETEDKDEFDYDRDIESLQRLI